MSGRHTVKRMDPEPLVQIISKHGYEITCQHCGVKAWKTSPNRAKYCGEPCRIAANEKRTGKKLRKKKRNG
ncbi:MAG: hypothetical protein GY940_31830 [bacterium]|nr:hypothetical protein [bacterium]